MCPSLGRPTLLTAEGTKVNTSWFGHCLTSLLFLPDNPTTPEDSRQITWLISDMLWLQPKSYRKNLPTALKCSGSLNLIWINQPHRTLTTHQGRHSWPEQMQTSHHPNPLCCLHLGSELLGGPGPHYSILLTLTLLCSVLSGSSSCFTSPIKTQLSCIPFSQEFSKGISNLCC